MTYGRTAPTAFVSSILLCAGGVASAGADAGSAPLDQEIDRHTLVVLSDQTPVRSFERHGRRLSVYGRPMANGASSQASADAFVAAEVDTLFGVAAADLRPGVTYADGAHVKGLMYDDERGVYRSLLHRYTQVVDGVPVFESELKVLVKNRPGFPVVLANSSLHDLGDFELARDAVGRVNVAQALAVATRELGPGAVLDEAPTPIIWAGTADDIDVPTFGARFVASTGEGSAKYEKWLFIIEPDTGRVLYRDDQVLHVDVSGNVSGWATEGSASDPCSDQAITPLPYARVGIGGSFTFADVNGDFVIPNGASDPVTVESAIRGPWFRVVNSAGPEAFLEQEVTPPGPADFVHNESGDEYTTAEVNCYIHANKLRDYVLSLDPGFPINDNEFRINVNLDNTCNAFYNGSSINFYRAGGACPNTGYEPIVYHEYGHHLVARATGSQCQWGEGNADASIIQVSDRPENGLGWSGDCDRPLRTADNECEYVPGGCSTCGGPCHDCGNLIAGCVWDLRNNLLITEPDDYRTIGGQLWIASLFMHTGGSTITPQVAIDYLVADDDDGNLENGTPHIIEITDAFAQHNMATPLLLLEFDIPGGAPTLIAPQGDQIVRVEITAAVSNPSPDTGVLYFNDGTGDGTGDGVVEVPMTEVEPNVYEVAFPATTCGVGLSYFFSVDTESGFPAFHPTTGAETPFVALSANAAEVVFADDFEDDLGWTITNDASSGIWEREVPAEDCGRGAPPFDADGSGVCFLTDNDPANCFRDVSFGTTTLTSPILDGSDPDSVITYWRWYDNTVAGQRTDPFTVEISDDAGAMWSTLEIVAPDSVEAEGGWISKTFRISDFVANTNQLRVRFIAEDLGTPAVVEAAVDGVVVRNLTCTACAEDLDGSGDVGFGDVLAVLAAWGQAGGPEDLDGSGSVEFGDLLLVLGNWGACS